MEKITVELPKEVSIDRAKWITGRMWKSDDTSCGCVWGHVVRAAWPAYDAAIEAGDGLGWGDPSSFAEHHNVALMGALVRFPIGSVSRPDEEGFFMQRWALMVASVHDLRGRVTVDNREAELIAIFAAQGTTLSFYGEAS